MTDDTRVSFAPVTRPEVPIWMNDYFFQIKRAIDQNRTLISEPLHNEPNISYDGLIVFADGTDWNPGAGRGLYYYDSAALPAPGQWVPMFESTILFGVHTANQVPVAVDTPLQVLFGAAQFGAGDPVQLDALGNLTINESGTYSIEYFLQIGRTGTGLVAWLMARGLINGTQVQNSFLVKFPTQNISVPQRFNAVLALTAGDVVTIEIMRDSQGANDGGLYGAVPTPVGWNVVPTASLTFRRV